MALNSGGWWIFRIFASSSLISSSISGNFSVTRWGFPPSPLCFGSTGAGSMGKARFTWVDIPFAVRAQRAGPSPLPSWGRARLRRRVKSE
jgi:hypothetical protein